MSGNDLKCSFCSILGVQAILSACICVVPVVTAAQTAAPPRPVIKSKAELVLVPAYVTRERQAVRGLKASDFELLHEGKPEKISVFDEIEEGTDAGQPVQAAPQTVTNYRTVEARKTATILLLDFLDMSALGWDRVHAKLTDVARVFVEEETPVVVLALSWNGLVEIMPLSADGTELVEGAERWKAMHNRQVPSGSLSSLSKTVGGSDGIARMLAMYGVTPDHAPADVIDKKTQEFNKYTMILAAIEEIAQAYGGLPERKKLIWISSDIPKYIRQADGKRTWGDRPMMNQQMLALKALTDANIAVYPVVANQLVATGGYDSCGAPISPDFYFVYETGGSVCDDAPQDCVKRALGDAKHYYLLGFYLHGRTKPGWHNLKVKVDRPNTNVRAKGAFIAGIQPGQNGILETETQFLEAALKSPLDYTGLPLSLRWSAIGVEQQDRKIELIVRSPRGAIATDGEPPSLNLKVVTYVVPQSGGKAQTFEANVTGDLTPDQQNELLSAGFLYRRTLVLLPGTYVIRVLVQDRVTNLTGTISATVDLTSDQER